MHCINQSFQVPSITYLFLFLSKYHNNLMDFYIFLFYLLEEKYFITLNQLYKEGWALHFL